MFLRCQFSTSFFSKNPLSWKRIMADTAPTKVFFLAILACAVFFVSCRPKTDEDRIRGLIKKAGQYIEKKELSKLMECLSDAFSGQLILLRIKTRRLASDIIFFYLRMQRRMNNGRHGHHSNKHHNRNFDHRKRAGWFDSRIVCRARRKKNLDIGGQGSIAFVHWVQA